MGQAKEKSRGMKQMMCPVCNGILVQTRHCPKCGGEMADAGRATDFFGPYSPYMEFDSFKQTQTVCVHLYTCLRTVLMKKPLKLKRPKHSSTEGRSMLRSWRVFKSAILQNGCEAPFLYQRSGLYSCQAQEGAYRRPGRRFLNRLWR